MGKFYRNSDGFLMLRVQKVCGEPILISLNIVIILRGDRGKMIHFFKLFFSCFYDWIYLITFKCIIHCQVLATF